jgi:general stress protein 26
MPNEAEIEKKFWKALKSDRTVMLGLDGVERAHPRPMAAQFDEDRAPIWFFTSNHSELVRALGAGSRAVATFAAKDHALFATMHGNLSLDNKRANIDRLWNRFVAAWFPGGKEDSKLALLRFDAAVAEFWLDDSSQRGVPQVVVTWLGKERRWRSRRLRRSGESVLTASALSRR